MNECEKEEEKRIVDSILALFRENRQAAEREILSYVRADPWPGALFRNRLLTSVFGEKGDGPWCQQPISVDSLLVVAENLSKLKCFKLKWVGRLFGWSFRQGFCFQYANSASSLRCKLNEYWSDSGVPEFLLSFPWRDLPDHEFGFYGVERIMVLLRQNESYSPETCHLQTKDAARILLPELRRRIRSFMPKLSFFPRLHDELSGQVYELELRSGFLDAIEMLGKATGRIDALTKQEVEFKMALSARIEVVKAERRAQCERERQDRELKAAAEAARRDEEKRRRKVFEHWEGLIADRCRHIVIVFNGIYGLDIDPDAVLQGIPPESYAYITSGSSGSGGSPGMGLRMALEQRQELRLREHEKTWLTIEQGDEEEEMRATFDAANLLVWHELGHLANPAALNKYLPPELLPLDSTEDLHSMAREVVIDAVAFRLAKTLYVHPDRSRHLIREYERQKTFCRSHLIQFRRVLRAAHDGSEDHSPLLIARLAAEAERHLAFDSGPELKEALAQAEPYLALERKALGIFREIYFRALTVDILTLDFRPSLCDEAEIRDGDERFTGVVAA